MKKGKPKTKREQQTPKKERESVIRGVKDEALKKLLEQRAKTNPGFAPPLKGKKGKKTDSGFIFMRPIRDDDDPDGPHPDDDPPPDDPCSGIVHVWQPDLAAQIETFQNECPEPQALGRIERALGGNLSRFRFTDPEVRVRCVAGVITIMVWGTKVVPGSCQDLARQRAQIPNLRVGGNFGVFINSNLIQRLATEAFQNAPKRFSGNGAPSLSGPLHITSLSIAFKSPDTIETYIGGYDERPWPDVYFTQTLIDRLRTLRQCESTEKTEYSKAAQIIGLLILGVLSFAIPMLIPVTAFVLFKDIDAALNQPDGEPQGGVGCRILESLPDEISLPQTGGLSGTLDAGVMAMIGPTVFDVVREKLVIAYGQPSVDSRGLFVSALASTQPRVPSIRVVGPGNLSIFHTGNQTSADYRVSADDFFGRLTFRWSASGGSNVQIQNPDKGRTRITFRRGNAKNGDTFERTISVRVTDQEGSSVTASRTVTLFVNEPDGTPPICQIRPWLPQCNPGGPEEPV